MFYSAKQFAAACTTQSNPVGSMDLFRRMRAAGFPKYAYADILREVKKAIIERRDHITIPEKWQVPPSFGSSGDILYIGKFFRPWDVCDHLRNWRPPAGDFGVGVEVEMGFRSLEACQDVVRAISNWRHITVDLEGPASPAEVTFPPILYSQYGSRSQPSRYLKLLKEREYDVHRHSADSWTGTHVNVSSGDTRVFSYDRARVLNNVIDRSIFGAEKSKYFGRSHPYGYAHIRGSFVEYKMFNSVIDWRRLRQYVDEAVSLTKLLISNELITPDSVRAALEEGFNKNPVA